MRNLSNWSDQIHLSDLRRSRQGLRVSMLVVAIAALSMGNQSCEQQDKGPRVLKMEVEIGALHARKVTTPSGETIDFPYVVNALFYRQVMSHRHFVIANPVPSPQSLINSASPSGPLGSSKVITQKIAEGTAMPEDAMTSERDLKVLERFGFIHQVRKQAFLQAREMSSGVAAKSASPQDVSKLPLCLYDLPQAQLGGEVISFEATWGIGLGIGYAANGTPLNGRGAGSVDFSQSKLELGLRTDDPLTRNTVAIADGVANQSKVQFGINFASGLPIGLNFFFNTPLSDVIRRAMDRGLDSIVDHYKTILSLNKDWNEVWESRVIYDPIIVDGDTHVAFRGGYRAGMMVGDKLTATNLHYAWEGAACYTRLKYKIPLTTTPVAELEVVSVGDNVAVARISKYFIEQRILPGAQIRVLALKQPTPAPQSAPQQRVVANLGNE